MVSIKAEHFLLFLVTYNFYVRYSALLGYVLRAAMHLNYRIHLAFGLCVTLPQHCHGFLQALLSSLTMQNRKCTQMVPQNEVCHYCVFHLQAPDCGSLFTASQQGLSISHFHRLRSVLHSKVAKLLVTKAWETGKTCNGLSYFADFVRAINLRCVGFIFIP